VADTAATRHPLAELAGAGTRAAGVGMQAGSEPGRVMVASVPLPSRMRPGSG